MSKKYIDKAAASNIFQHAIEGHEQVFESFFLAKLLGLSFDYGDDDALTISFDVNEMFTNPQGTFHGGMIATVLDISMGHLLNKAIGPGSTIEMKIQYLRPVVDGQVICKSRFIKKGRSINFLESHLYNAEDKLCAHATATWKLISS
ncbi:hypothetical protein HIMB100_00002410 [SAR116 cluster alpha proteobacterium HIMB100]|nr:hypothetical protein HIMB100_00002410 [SAR116 cluster alpha proteobacterium HIMB100]